MNSKKVLLVYPCNIFANIKVVSTAFLVTTKYSGNSKITISYNRQRTCTESSIIQVMPEIRHPNDTIYLTITILFMREK